MRLPGLAPDGAAARARSSRTIGPPWRGWCSASACRCSRTATATIPRRGSPTRNRKTRMSRKSCRRRSAAARRASRYCEVLIVSPGERSTWGPMRRRHAQAAARDRRVRGRAGHRRQLRGRGAGGARQLQHPGGGDVRRLRLRVADPACRPARADRGLPAAGRRGARRRSRHAAFARACAPSGPSSTSTSPPTATSRQLAGADEAAGIRRVFYGARGAAGAAPRDPRRHQGPLRDAVLRQPEEVRAAPDRHLPRAADRARQVDLQVELDPRHGRVLRRQPVPRRVLAPPPAAWTACSSPPATSRWRRTRRRAPSAAIALTSSPTAPRPRTRSSHRRCAGPATSC